MGQFPRQLQRILPLREVNFISACAGVATGLFDSAINYAWNSAIIELRERFDGSASTSYHRSMAAVLMRRFDRAQGCNFLSLCLKLNLITEDGFFMLDQCRPCETTSPQPIQPWGASMMLSFSFPQPLRDVCSLDERNPKGVDTQALLKAVKAGRFSE